MSKKMYNNISKKCLKKLQKNVHKISKNISKKF